MLQFAEIVGAVILGNIIFFFIVSIFFHIETIELKKDNWQNSKQGKSYSYRLLYFEYVDSKDGPIFHFFDKENNKFLFSAKNFEEVEKNCLEIYEKSGIDYSLRLEDIKKFFDIFENYA